MASQGSFTTCMEQMRKGDSLAETIVYDRYFRRLMGLARSHMKSSFSSKLDPDDVVQSVFHSFFQRNAAGLFSYEDWDSLWALLARITIRKCCRQAEALSTAKRDIDRETRLAELEIVSREPTPEQASILADLLQHLFAGLTGPQREVLAYKLEYLSNEEISERIGRTERSVYRALATVRKQLELIEQE